MNCELRIQRDGVHVLGAQWLGTEVTETRNPPHQEKLYSCFLSTVFFPVMGLNICGLPTLWISAWQWAPANTAPQAKFSRLLGGIWCPNLNAKRSWGWHGHQPDLNGQQQRCSMSCLCGTLGLTKGTQRQWTVRRVSREWLLWSSCLSCWHPNFAEH